MSPQKVTQQRKSVASVSTNPATVNTGRTRRAEAKTTCAEVATTVNPPTSSKDCGASLEKDTVTHKALVKSSAGNEHERLAAQPVGVDDTLACSITTDRNPNAHPASDVSSPPARLKSSRRKRMLRYVCQGTTHFLNL